MAQGGSLRRRVSAQVRVERNPKKKAYMRLHTTVGDLNLELHSDIAPRTVENFLLLAEEGYYKDTVFHRCIKHFMIQVRYMLPVAHVWKSGAGTGAGTSSLDFSPGPRCGNKDQKKRDTSHILRDLRL